jgi:hypothetical protein
VSFLTKAKKVVGKLMGKQDMIDEATQDEENLALIEQWKPVFEADKSAKRPWNARFDEWEEMYQGSRDFNNSNPSFTENREMRTNINFPRMIVESLIDLGVPDPDFKAVSKDDEQPVQMLENYVKYIVRSAQPSLQEINLHNERRVMKFGGAFWKIHWENNIKKAGYVGEIGISMPQPKDIIPNHGATSTDDMSHYHHIVNRTANEIIHKWSHITVEDLEGFAALFHEYDEMTGSQRINVSQQSGDKEMGLQKYTVIETTYKDEDGDICKLWWSGDLVIQHLPKFYYRRIDGEITTTETLSNGTKIRAGIDEEGKIIFNEVKTTKDDEGNVIKDGEDTEYYIPKSWDLIYQPFIPRDKCFWGISLMEDIYDLNEAIKKAVYIHEEQYLKGTKKILVGSERLKVALESSVSSVEYVPDPNQMVKEIDMATDLDGIVWVEKLKEWMQLLTGATNATLGVRDSSVNSARQAQVYIEQANFKVALKTAYKSSCYKRIYRTIADFALAFIDEARPFRLEGITPKPQTNPDGTKFIPKAIYGEFNRMNMLRDQSGNYIYPDFDIEVNAEAVFLKSKSEIFNALVTLAGQGRFEPNPGNLAFLQVLSKLGVPDLQEVIDAMEQEIKEQKQIAMSMPTKGAKEQKGPAESIAFKDLPLSGKIQMAAQAGIQLQSQDLVGIEAQGAQESTQSQQQQPNLEAILSRLTPEAKAMIQQNPEILQKILGGGQG